MIATSSRPNQGLNESQMDSVVRTMNHLLADEFLLYTKTLNYHWNVTGPRFRSLHEFFEEQYEKLAELIDAIAETARKNGGRALGTMSEFLKETHLREREVEAPSAERMVENLLNDHEGIIRELRDAVRKCDEDWNAADAADFLTSVMEDHQKMAWMLRATSEH